MSDGRVHTVRTSAAVDPSSFEGELVKAMESEVRFDSGTRALYATNASNYRQVPIGVVVPLTQEDVERTQAVCRRHGAPILSHGGGASLAGQTANAAVVIDFSKYLNRLLDAGPKRGSARVEPGCKGPGWYRGYLHRGPRSHAPPHLQPA
jgi:FAD/FMN-containing dehydrogenase